MTLKILVLFFTPLLSGLLIFLVPKGKSTNYKMLLVFAGSYLFAITVIHILPELYRQSLGLELIGLFVLVGFFCNSCWNILRPELSMVISIPAIPGTPKLTIVDTITNPYQQLCC